MSACIEDLIALYLGVRKQKGNIVKEGWGTIINRAVHFKQIFQILKALQCLSRSVDVFTGIEHYFELKGFPLEIRRGFCKSRTNIFCVQSYQWPEEKVQWLL